MKTSNTYLQTGILWNMGSLAILGVSGIAMNVLIDVFRGELALGIFSQCFALFIINSQIGVGGLQLSTLKHVSHAQEDLNQCKAIVLCALLLCAVMGTIICVILFFIRTNIANWFQSPDLQVGIACMIPGLFLFSMNKILLMTVNGLRYMRAFAVFQAIRPILILIGIMLVMGLGWSDSWLACALSFSEIIIFIILSTYLSAKVLKYSQVHFKDIKYWLNRHVSFGVRGCLSGILIELNTRVDVLMIGLLMSDEMVGIYVFGAVFAEGYAQLSYVIRQNIDPIIGKAFASDKLQEIEEVGKKIKNKFFPKMLLVGGLMILAFPLLLTVLEHAFNREVKLDSFYVLIILVVCYCIASLYQPFIGLLLQGDRPGVFTFLIIVTVIGNILLNIILLPVIGIYGAALGTGIMAIIQGLGIVYLAKKYLKVQI